MADEPVVAGGVINIPTEDIGTPSSLSMITIVKQAARVVGSQNDPTVIQAGLEALQSALNDMNIRSSFDFTIVVDTDITLVENQRDYTIPSNAFALKEIVLVDDSETPERILPLGYIDWDQLNRLFDQRDAGFPNFWTARDVFLNRLITLPLPANAETAGRWKLRVFYRTAIQKPAINDPLITISGPDVITTVIQRYIEYRLLTIFADPSDPRIARTYREYRDQLIQLRGMENRSRPGGTQIRTAAMTNNTIGGTSHRRGGLWR